MHTLYPAIKPFATHAIPVTELHTLYVEESGSKEGLPVIVLHSGPGAGSDAHMRRFFDPQRYRIILFDQRGCGRSTPHASLHANTTQALIEDIESLRNALQIDRFVLFGSGFGTTLAVLYAQRYPHHIQALLLHQVFLARKEDIQWFFNHGASQIYPDYWGEFTHQLPKDALANIPEFYHQCLSGENEVARMAAAKSWALWQARCCSLQPHLSLIDHYSDPHFALTLATIESHYVVNQYFIEENAILNNTHKIRHIPCFIVHGRYNMICSLDGAWQLSQSLMGSNLRIIRDAGYSDREPGTIDALIDASKAIVKQSLNAS